MTEEIIPYEAARSLAAVNEGQRAMLMQQTPKSAILTRKGKGGKVFSYVPHAWVTEKLNEAFGWAWSWDISEWRAFPEVDPVEVFVLGKLTVHSPHGDLVKSQFGSSDVKRDREGKILSLGDELKSASSDALKKAASLLGIGLDLYHADVKPVDDDHEAGLADDPMTAYWAATKAKGMTQAEGATLLQRHKGNPDRALAELAQQPAPQAVSKPTPPANGKRDKLHARLDELALELNDWGVAVELDPGWLATATEAELTAEGKGLRQQLDALKTAKAEQPALLDKAA